MLRLIICFTIGIPFIILLVIVPKKSPYWVVLIFRTIVPAFMGNFYLFGLSKKVSFKVGLANEEIVNDKQVSTEYEEMEEYMAKKKL